jgi:hypothetical protein
MIIAVRNMVEGFFNDARERRVMMRMKLLIDTASIASMNTNTANAGPLMSSLMVKLLLLLQFSIVILEKLKERPLEWTTHTPSECYGICGLLDMASSGYG